ncbi:MAG: rRNA pseudouridine synthase [Planctomycetes bacterium]|nr:rRNA pseudouridine synthase [Planctomycetota bacterium]
MRHSVERVLSKSGLCSRKQALVLVRAGRVRLNGRCVQDALEPCDPARDDLRVDGQRVAAAERIYVALHKPRGVLTTRVDPSGRPTVYGLLADLDAWVVPVGRLDGDTSGLLLFTNDTAFAELITNPQSHVEKVYVVTARPRLFDAALQRLERGVELSDGPTRAARVVKLGDRGSSTRFELALTEGRNRQVRRMVRAVGSKVERLHRRSIGPLELGELPSGAWRRLERREVLALRAAARASAEARAPGRRRGG